MYKNKIFAIIMTLIMAMSLCPAAVSAQTPLEEKSTVNVALGKAGYGKRRSQHIL